MSEDIAPESMLSKDRVTIQKHKETISFKREKPRVSSKENGD